VHELRRAAKRSHEHPAVSSLKAELDELRQELAALKASQHGAGHDDDELPLAPGRAAAGRKPAVATRPVTSVRVKAKAESAKTEAAKLSTPKATPKAKPARASSAKPAARAATRTAKGK
jgi:hypothetical protein